MRGGVPLLLEQGAIDDRSARDLVGHWPLASDGAINLHDLSGNAYSLTNNGSVARGAGPSNALPDAAVLVRATPSYLSFTSSFFNPGSRPFGMCLWANRSADANDGFSSPLGKYGAAGHRSWAVERVTSTGRFTLLASADGTNIVQTLASTDDTLVASGSWGFVAGWWDGSRLNCQVNMGIIRPSAAFTGPVFASDMDVTIGNSITGLRWDGSVADVRFWLGRIPTQEELSAIYNAGR